MLNLKKAFLTVCALCLLAYTNVATASDSLVVKNVEVKLSGGNPVKLRTQALEQAKQKAFPQLLKQLTPRKTWPAHARVLGAVNYDEVSFKTQVVKENMSGGYKAVFDVYYLSAPVKKLLERYNLPYTISSGGKVLILPIFEENDVKLLWETINPLTPVVESNARSIGYFDYMLPEGNSTEVQTLSADMAVLGAGDLILKLAEDNGASAAVVLYTKVSQRMGGVYLDVTANWYEQGVYGEPAIFTTPVENPQFQNGNLTALSLKPALNAAVKNVLPRLGDHKRTQELVEVNRPGRVFLRFKPADAKDLEKLKSAVEGINTIRDFKLRVLNVKDSVFQVDFFGDKFDFQNKLEEKGLVVTSTSMQMVWKVAFKDDPFLGPVNYDLGDE